MRVGLVIVAAGSGSRLGAGVPKAFVPLAGMPILGHALRGALSCPDIGEIVVVAPAGWAGHADAVCRRAETQTARTPHTPLRIVVGGAERGDSVAAGLAALSEQTDAVLVHDAARALAPVDVYDRVISALRAGAVAVVPGLPVIDTIKQVDADGIVLGTPERSTLRVIQTPQGFRRAVLERAHAATSDATDDAGLVERLGEAVIVVPGDERARKITTPGDLAEAARILAG